MDFVFHSRLNTRVHQCHVRIIGRWKLCGSPSEKHWLSTSINKWQVGVGHAPPPGANQVISCMWCSEPRRKQKQSSSLSALRLINYYYYYSMFITPVDDIEVFNMLKKLIKINLLDLTAFQQTCFKSTLRLLLFPLKVL